MTAPIRGPEASPAFGEAETTDEIVRLETTLDGFSVEAGIDQELWNEKFKSTLEELKGYSPRHYAHSLRVGVYTYGLAKMEGQPDLHLPLLGAAGHDLGKLDVDQEVLEITGEINDEQRELIKPHAEKGYRRWRDAGFPSPAFIAARHHCFQDKPYGVDLSDEPLLREADDRTHVEDTARLVALVDSFDAARTRGNDQGSPVESSEKAQKDKLLKRFPDCESRIDWLFANKLP